MKIVIKKTENTQSMNADGTIQDRVLKCAEIECPLCNIGKCECDCDKCGVTGCYECVTGGHGTGEDMNICNECL